MTKHSQTIQKMQIYTIALLSVLLTGCASSMGAQKNFSEEAKRYIQNGEWEKGYRTLEDALGSSESAIRLAAYDLIVANQELRIAALETFSTISLSKTFASFDSSTANSLESVRLEWYAKFASDEELLKAQSNLEVAYAEANRRKSSLADARRNGLDALVVDDAIFGQLVSVDQIRFRTMYPNMLVIPFDSVGIIRTHQVIDKSTTGSSAGSQLGSAVAQAAYIDRSFSRYNYSALGQLSAGLLGGLIGSSLNTTPQSRYLINYGVELRDGTIKGVLKSSSDGMVAPTGQCIFTNDVQEAPKYLCNDNFAAFIERAKRQGLLTNKSEVGKPQDKVDCKIDVVGTLKLDREACQKSNGTVVP